MFIGDTLFLQSNIIREMLMNTNEAAVRHHIPNIKAKHGSDIDILNSDQMINHRAEFKCRYILHIWSEKISPCWINNVLSIYHYIGLLCLTDVNPKAASLIIDMLNSYSDIFLISIIVSYSDNAVCFKLLNLLCQRHLSIITHSSRSCTMIWCHR